MVLARSLVNRRLVARRRFSDVRFREATGPLDSPSAGNSQGQESPIGQDGRPRFAKAYLGRKRRAKPIIAFCDIDEQIQGVIPML